MSLKINGSSKKYTQVKYSIERRDLPLWLSQQNDYPKVYWQDRDTRIEYAAVGSVLSFAEPPLFDESPPCPVRLYGGMHFPKVHPKVYLAQCSPLWTAFPKCAFWLPSFEIMQTCTGAELIFHDIDKKSEMHTPVWEERKQAIETPLHVVQREEALSLHSWQQCIEHLRLKLQEDEIKKVVLAQKKQFLFSHPLCPWNLLHKLRQHNCGATVFAFERAPHVAFLGASPERFFYRKDRRITIDAVAATRKRGTSAEEDLSLEKELHRHPKEKQEFAYVKDYIHRTLHPFSLQCTWQSEDTVLKTAHMQHLYNRVDATLKSDVTDSALISALHPTPAVGGFPRDKALALIAELEPFYRGWYASPVGWISPDESNLIVAIRSGLILDTALHLFAGAGIVAESSAEREWEEINDKMRLFTDGCGIA